MKKAILNLFVAISIAACGTYSTENTVSDPSAVRDANNNILGMQEFKMEGKQGKVEGKQTKLYRLLLCKSTTPQLIDEYLGDERFCKNPFIEKVNDKVQEYVFGETPERSVKSAVAGYGKGTVAVFTIVVGSVATGIVGGGFIGGVAAGGGLSGMAAGTGTGATIGAGIGFAGSAVASFVSWMEDKIWGYGQRAAFHHWDDVFSKFESDDKENDLPEVKIRKVLEAIGKQLNVEPNLF